mmetsp:Transcript_50615/g.98987  ORF Transcript_50615/g.98987 Transcript_50615/m.98987 type:complete len:201 (-) Transcript_50615:1918-2520(-)
MGAPMLLQRTRLLERPALRGDAADPDLRQASRTGPQGSLGRAGAPLDARVGRRREKELRRRAGGQNGARGAQKQSAPAADAGGGDVLPPPRGARGAARPGRLREIGAAVSERVHDLAHLQVEHRERLVPGGSPEMHGGGRAPGVLRERGGAGRGTGLLLPDCTAGAEGSGPVLQSVRRVGPDGSAAAARPARAGLHRRTR